MLRDYQIESFNSVLKSFKDNRKVMLQLPTGAGKTFTFCTLAKRYTLKGKVHILVNRIELVEQTYKTLTKLGVNTEKITAKQKVINRNALVYVGMCETVNNRIKKGKLSVDDIGLCIIDEAHRGEFTKLLEYYKGFILGCSATPVVLKRIHFTKCNTCGSTDLETCCGEE